MYTKQFQLGQAQYETPEVLVVTTYEDGVICDSFSSDNGEISDVTTDNWGEF